MSIYGSIQRSKLTKNKYLYSYKNSYNPLMNILRNLLFSLEGKIGRADYIYGITYVILVFFVSIDAFINPSSIFLIWWGIDFVQVLIYIASFLGIALFIWMYLAITWKRSRALDIEIRWSILGLVFPPLLLAGLMKDEEKYEYCAGLSLVDQIFFYILICIILLCIFFFYDIHASLSFILFIIAITAVFSVFFMWKDRRPYNHIPKIKYTGLDAWLDLFFVLVIVFFIRSYILSPFQIIWPSMESTFQGGKITYTAWWQKYSDGEFILVDKMTYRLSRPKRGDVIVFTPWIGPEKRFLIKRVIGLPGDTVKIENGYVSIATKDNPEKFVLINESQYLEKKFGYTCLVYNNTGCEKESQTFLVPAWKYFLLGDNRPQSLDSRKCFSNSGCTGEYILAQFVPISHIQWRVVYSLWHFDIFSQILPYPKIGTWQSVVPYRGLGIQNTHHYPELSQ